MTRKRIICVLDFLSGVRSGGLSGDLDRVDGGIHASTVWGGVGCSASRLFPGEIVDRLTEEGSISSLLWEKDGVYYLPRPPVPFPGVSPEKRKAAREWTWIPLQGVSDFVFNGKLPPLSPEPLFREERQRSAAVDRCTNSAVPYFRKRIVPLERVSGVLVADMPDDLAASFRAAMALLGDTGLGGERSSGNGHFSVHFLDGEQTPFGHESGDFREPTVALGAFLPTEDESARIRQCARAGETPIGYELTRIRGFTGESSDISKPTVTCLSAGSVIPFLPKGRTIDITPQFAGHPVVFNGMPPFLSLAGRN